MVGGVVKEAWAAKGAVGVADLEEEVEVEVEEVEEGVGAEINWGFPHCPQPETKIKIVCE